MAMSSTQIPSAVSAIDYWDTTSDLYHARVNISVEDFHFAPLLPGNSDLGLLPGLTSDTRCLELGCGGGQNSIYLSRQGARCVALDGSYRQLAYAADLAQKYEVQLDLVQADLEAPALPLHGKFDLIHSAYTLPFLADQTGFIKRIREHLKPGGVLLFSTAHPLAHAEWISIEDGFEGIILQDYYRPPVDERQEHNSYVCVTPVPVSALTEALSHAGFAITRLLEPQPVMSRQDNRQHRSNPPPYDCRAWRMHEYDMTKIPRFLIIKAQLDS